MDLPYDLPDGFVATAVETIAGIYHLNRDRHDPEAGDDAMTFGIHSYRNVHNALEAHFEGSADAIPLRENGVVVLEVHTSLGPVWVRVYKAGRTPADDPRNWRCDEREAALRHARTNGPARQLSLFDGAADVPRALVLLHVGNEVDGLRAVHIGAPAIRDGRQVDWHFLVTLWQEDTTSVDLTDVGDTEAFDVQSEPAVVVQLRPPPTEIDDSGEQDGQ